MKLSKINPMNNTGPEGYMNYKMSGGGSSGSGGNNTNGSGCLSIFIAALYFIIIALVSNALNIPFMILMVLSLSAMLIVFKLLKWL